MRERERDFVSEGAELAAEDITFERLMKCGY